LPEVLKEGVNFKRIVDSTQGGSSDVRFRRNPVMKREGIETAGQDRISQECGSWG
jgi:hypothetical protein